MSFPTNVKSKQHAPIVRPHDFVNINSLLPAYKKRSSSKKHSSKKHSSRKSKLRSLSSVKSSSVKSSSSA
jgi:hypothetical protein